MAAARTACRAAFWTRFGPGLGASRPPLGAGGGRARRSEQHQQSACGLRSRRPLGRQLTFIDRRMHFIQVGITGGLVLVGFQALQGPGRQVGHPGSRFSLTRPSQSDGSVTRCLCSPANGQTQGLLSRVLLRGATASDGTKRLIVVAFKNTRRRTCATPNGKARYRSQICKIVTVISQSQSAAAARGTPSQIGYKHHI